jgi:hypothetical protein
MTVVLPKNWSNANLIIPRLWLGNYESSQDKNFIMRNRITVIINCSKDLPFVKLNGILKYRVPVHDNLDPFEINSMTKWIKKILPIIHYHYQQGRSILVHCAAGMQRSAIVVLSYLHQYHINDPAEALMKVKSKRVIAFMPYMNFKHSFCQHFGYDACQQLQKALSNQRQIFTI